MRRENAGVPRSMATRLFLWSGVVVGNVPWVWSDESTVHDTASAYFPPPESQGGWRLSVIRRQDEP